MWVGALSARNASPTPWNRPSRSNSLSSAISSITSSAGKSSTRITRLPQSSRKRCGSRRNAAAASASISASEGALTGRQANGSENGGSLMAARSAGAGEREPDAAADQDAAAQARGEAHAARGQRHAQSADQHRIGPVAQRRDRHEGRAEEDDLVDGIAAGIVELGDLAQEAHEYLERNGLVGQR